MNNREEDWVKARADCTPASLYSVITDRVSNDVRAFNTLMEKRKIKKHFIFVPEQAGMRVYAGEENNDTRKDRWVYTPDESAYIEVRLAEGVIVATCGRENRIEVITRWNEVTLTCDFLIDGEVLSLSRISQKILGDFLFEV